MITRTRKRLVTAAAVLACIPSVAQAEDNDYSYWNTTNQQPSYSQATPYDNDQYYRPVQPQRPAYNDNDRYYRPLKYQQEAMQIPSPAMSSGTVYSQIYDY